jgi:hypothetical protein
MLSHGYTLLATGTDVGLLGEAAAKNAACLQRLRSSRASQQGNAQS